MYTKSLSVIIPVVLVVLYMICVKYFSAPVSRQVTDLPSQMGRLDWLQQQEQQTQQQQKQDQQHYYSVEHGVSTFETPVTDNPVVDEQGERARPKLMFPWLPPQGEVCSKRLPTAIVAGVQKGGTSALLNFLNAHPQVVGCLSPAEVRFFVTRGRYERGYEWYQDAMPCSYSNQVTVEKSPPYFHTRGCAARIRKMDPNMRIIIIVKDPISRLQSWYAMIKAHANRPILPLGQMVTDSASGEIITDLNGVIISSYDLFIRQWIIEFGLKQIHIVDGNNFETNPAEELGRVEEFLNLGAYFTLDMFTYNTTKNKYCVTSPQGETTCLPDNKGRTHEELNLELSKKLLEFYAPHNELFFQLIHRTLPWGY